MFFGLRSGDKQEEIRKQYFEIYKKILNFYFLNNQKLDGIIEKNDNNLTLGSILFVCAGIQIFGDFKNNEAVFPAGENNEYELKVKFNISEDKKLHLEIDEKEIANDQIKKYKLDLKIPEISEDKVIKFDDNAVRCKVLQRPGLDFELKDKKTFFIPNNFEPKKELMSCISSIVYDAGKNWVEYGGCVLPDGKNAKKLRRFVEISEDFKKCVLQDTFYEDEECKNAIGNNKWEFDIIKSKEDKKELKKEDKKSKSKIKSGLLPIKEEEEEEDYENINSIN